MKKGEKIKKLVREHYNRVASVQVMTVEPKEGLATA